MMSDYDRISNLERRVEVLEKSLECLGEIRESVGILLDRAQHITPPPCVEHTARMNGFEARLRQTETHLSRMDGSAQATRWLVGLTVVNGLALLGLATNAVIHLFP